MSNPTHRPQPDTDLPYHAGDRCATCGAPIVTAAAGGWAHADYQPLTGNCPPWCDTDHERTRSQDMYVGDNGYTVYELRTHSRDVAVFDHPTLGPGKRVYVAVRMTDDLQEGTRSPAAVTVDGAEGLSPELARRVGDAIHAAARLAAGS